jgi:hypothetical protein
MTGRPAPGRHSPLSRRKPTAAASIRTAGVVLVLLPTVAYGDVSLVGFISRRSPGCLDNPVRQNPGGLLLAVGTLTLGIGLLRA